MPFPEGHLVKIKHCTAEEAEQICDAAGIHFASSMARFLGSGGVVQEASRDQCDVYTPDA